MRSRESRCCSPPSPPPREIQNAAARHDHRRGKSAGDNITHPLAPSRSPFNSHRNAASLKPVAVPHLRLRKRYCKSGMRVSLHSQTSQVFRRQLHAFTHPPAPPRSPFNSHRNATSPKRDCFFHITEHPMLPQQQPVSSNSASYVLSVSCLFLCGPLRRISVNARFYVQCCLVL